MLNNLPCGVCVECFSFTACSAEQGRLLRRLLSGDASADSGSDCVLAGKRRQSTAEATLQSAIECYRALQSATERYRALQRCATERYRASDALESATERYRVLRRCCMAVLHECYRQAECRTVRSRDLPRLQICTEAADYYGGATNSYSTT